MTTSIGFTPALPCSTVKGNKLCGKPATAGTLYPTSGGNYILQPFCRECTQSLLKVYGPPAELFPPSPTTPADAEQQAIRAIGIVKKARERFGEE